MDLVYYNNILSAILLSFILIISGKINTLILGELHKNLDFNSLLVGTILTVSLLSQQ